MIITLTDIFTMYVIFYISRSGRDLSRSVENKNNRNLQVSILTVSCLQSRVNSRNAVNTPIKHTLRN